MYLWRAVDSEGDILDALAQPKRVVGAPQARTYRLYRQGSKRPGKAFYSRLT
jgi:transposase-like protein